MAPRGMGRPLHPRCASVAEGRPARPCLPTRASRDDVRGRPAPNPLHLPARAAPQIVCHESHVMASRMSPEAAQEELEDRQWKLLRKTSLRMLRRRRAESDARRQPTAARGPLDSPEYDRASRRRFKSRVFYHIRRAREWAAAELAAPTAAPRAAFSFGAAQRRPRFRGPRSSRSLAPVSPLLFSPQSSALVLISASSAIFRQRGSGVAEPSCAVAPRCSSARQNSARAACLRPV